MKKQELVDKINELEADFALQSKHCKDLVSKRNELQTKLDLQEKLYSELVDVYQLCKDGKAQDVQDLKTQTKRIQSEQAVERSQAKQILKNMKGERDDLSVKLMKYKDLDNDLKEYRNLACELKIETIDLGERIIKLTKYIK